MRTISIILLLIFSFPSQGQTKNPFLFVKFDKVIMYDYQPAGEYPALVDKNGNLVSNASIKKQVQLDSATINKLNRKIGDRKSYGQVTAVCFDPHLGIVYYLNGKIVRRVLVCIDCNALRAHIDIPARHQNKQSQGDNAYYLDDGMSKSFREFINSLLIKYNFSHQIKPGPGFDK
jgi:hypothetical protein